MICLIISLLNMKMFLMKIHVCQYLNIQYTFRYKSMLGDIVLQYTRRFPLPKLQLVGQWEVLASGHQQGLRGKMAAPMLCSVEDKHIRVKVSLKERIGYHHVRRH